MNHIDTFNTIANTLERQSFGELPADETPEVVKAIIRNPLACPICKSIKIKTVDARRQEHIYFQDMLCSECGMKWIERWSLEVTLP